MSIVWTIASVVASLALEWTGNASRIPFFSALPVASFVVLWRMDRLSVVPRTASAAVAGFFLDSVVSRPFGTYILLFLVLAGITEFLHVLFSARDSRAARAMSAVLVLGLFFIMMPLASGIMGSL